jgi:hypothetical protein
MDATAAALPTLGSGPETPTITTTTALPPITTHTSAAAATRFNALTARIFLTEPITRILRLEADCPPNNLLTASHVLAGYSQRTSRKLADGGVIIEAGDWAAAAIWDPPGATVMGPPLSESERKRRPVFARFMDGIAAAKLKYMGPTQLYWHLSMMARDPLVQPPVKGAVRAVIEPYLHRAKAEGLPVWIEAGNARARDVYAYLGFEVLEELRMGEGTHRADGSLADTRNGDDAPGVPVWFMIFNHDRSRSVQSGLTDIIIQ